MKRKREHSPQSSYARNTFFPPQPEEPVVAQEAQQPEELEVPQAAQPLAQQPPVETRDQVIARELNIPFPAVLVREIQEYLQEPEDPADSRPGRGCG